MIKLDFKAIYEWPFSLQLLIILPICIVLIYLAYFFDFTGMNKTLQDKKNQQADLYQQIDMILSQQVKLENELAKYDVYDDIMALWQARLVKDAMLPTLLNDILKMGTAKGLKFENLQPGEAVKEDVYTKTPIKIIAAGEYNQAASFISDIANHSSLIVIKAIAFEKPKDLDLKGKSLAEQAALKNLLTVATLLEVYDQAKEGVKDDKNEKK